MKKMLQKNLMIILMALMFIVSVAFISIPMTAYAAPAIHTAHKGSDKDGSKHEGWTAISSENDLKELGEKGGSAFLTKDITIKKSAFVICEDKEVNLCLNGHKIIQAKESETETVSLSIKSKLNLFDESGNTGRITHAKDHIGFGVYSRSAEFTMNGGNIYGNTAKSGAGVYCHGGTFVLNGGTISNNSTSGGNGGGVMAYSGSFTMNGGSITGNYSAFNGGALVLNGGPSGSEFTMNGGTISNNSSKNVGGAIYSIDSNIYLEDGIIKGNNSDTSAGGVYIVAGSLYMSGGTIMNNEAVSNGGGINVTYANCYISGGTIKGNIVKGNGGGIYLYNGGLKFSGGEITGNIAETNSGGGLYSYDSVLIMSGGKISDNTSREGGGLSLYNEERDYKFTIDGGIIKDNSSKESGDDVYIYGKGVISDGIIKGDSYLYPTYGSVKFFSNKGKGTAYTQYYKLSGNDVLTENRYTRSGYTFYNWNTKADGSGKTYKDGAQVTENSPSKLYAQWAPAKYTVSFDANGGSGTMSSQSIKFNTSTALSKNTFKKSGYVFNCWNTKADGSGTSYEDADKVKLKTLNVNKITLYAQWASPKSVYKVEHYKQKLDGSYNKTAHETESFTGKTNSNVTPDVKEYKGFTAPETQTVKIKADGTVVVKYYYTRNSYKLTWDFAGGKASGSYSKGKVKYGAKITAPVPEKDGYEFTGWDKTVSKKMPAKNLTYTATWRKLTKKENVTKFVERFYTIILDRPAEAAGLKDWTNKLLNKEATGAQVAAGFINSDEFRKKKMSDDEYLKKLYKAFFNREPDADGYNHWMNKLKSGASRDEVLRGFIGSPEFNDLCKKYGIDAGSY
ncbi:MAG: DUF4214 domain-containing protein [Lachnospiraceae bacterium]|nr:DUF4214 domain-containing protein [Lachnospiraceae bacterium]